MYIEVDTVLKFLFYTLIALVWLLCIGLFLTYPSLQSFIFLTIFGTLLTVPLVRNLKLIKITA